MPPPLPPQIGVPATFDRDAKHWLESKGLPAVVPTIRSSDFSLARSNPFMYYLVRRLGLVKALRWSKALSRGSWFHRLMELRSVPDLSKAFDRILTHRIRELESVGKMLGLQPEGVAEIVAREQKDAMVTMGWFRVMLDLPLPNRDFTLRSLLSRFRALGPELRLICPYPTDQPSSPNPMGGLRLVAALDDLLYKESTNELWIADWKTCDDEATTRLITCPIEHQTIHYLYVTQRLLDAGILQRKFGLPADVKLGGMMHVAFRKPTIEFGTKDRDKYLFGSSKRAGVTVKASPIKRGKLDGQWHCVSLSIAGEILDERTVTGESDARGWLAERCPTKIDWEYSGEPSLDNYVARVRDWLRAEGEYENLQTERKPGSVLDISWTNASILLEPYVRNEYHAELRHVGTLALIEGSPENFPRNAATLRAHNRLSEYTPFFLNLPGKWPTIAQQEGFIRASRDEDIPTEMTLDVLETIHEETSQEGGQESCQTTAT